MPNVRRQNVPPALLQHLLDREPEVPEGQWYARFPDRI
jgi:hypothetical protein